MDTRAKVLYHVKSVLPLSLKAKAIRSEGDRAIMSPSRSRVGNGPLVYDAFSTCVETGSEVLGRQVAVTFFCLEFCEVSYYGLSLGYVDL